MDFKKYIFKDVATLVNGRAYLMPELQTEGKYRIVRVGNFSGKDEWFYSDMELEDDKYCLKGDLLYKWACNFGPEIWTEEKSIYHYHIWKVLNNNCVDKTFLYYYLKYITPYWLGGTNGTTMVHITKESMEKKKIFIPEDKTVQEKIRNVLLHYDELIEINKKRINILEDVAANIYKEWFINFRVSDCIKIKSTEGNPNGWILSDRDYVMSIPEGWNFGILKNIASFSRGKNITSDEMNEGTIPVASAGLDYSGYHNESNVKGYSLTVSASGANAGYLAYHLEDIWAADCSYYQGENIWFVYNTLKFLQPVITNMQVGAAQPHVYAKNINKLSIIIPPNELIKLYCDKVNPLYEKIKIIKEKNKNLVKQRDLLLPRLMSGKLSVEGKEIV